MSDASINDDVELGLMPGFDPLGVDTVNKDTLINPPTANETQVQPTIITDVSQKLPSQTTSANDFFGDNYVLGEVPDIEANIKVIDTAKEALENLSYVKSELTRHNSISKEDYLSIEPLLTKNKPRVSLEEFSKTRSKTHYKTVMESIDQAIEIEKEAITKTYQSLYDESLEDLEEYVEHFERYYLPFIQSMLEKVAFGFGEMLERLSSSKNVYVFDKENKLINLRETAILDSPILDELVSDDSQWHHGLKIIRTAISIPALAHFIWTVNTGRKGHYHLYAQTMAEGISYGKEMTLGDLITFYRNRETITVLLNEMLVESQGCVNELCNMKSAVKDMVEPEVRQHAFMNSDRLVHISSSFMYNKSVTDNLGLLNVALVHCREVLQYLSK